MNTYKFKVRFLKDYQRSSSDASRLLVEEEDFRPKADIYKDGKRELIILGSPIYRDRIDNKIVSHKISETGMSKSFIRDLDGSFLLIFYDEGQSTLTLANDRFASIPFFYYLSDKTGFVGSVNYSDIWSELCQKSNLIIKPEAFYEFIHLQRLLGDKTYDTKTKYLNSASILTFDTNSSVLRLERYWRPNFAKKSRSIEESSRILADLVRKAISKRTGDGKRYGLLLSGGLDSRLVLAGFHRPIECLTVGLDENNECRVAKALAYAKGYSHSFVKRKSTHYGDILEQAVFLGSAMNSYFHAHYLNMTEELGAKADIFFHGHGFDYMFQGKYIPHTTIKIFNVPTYIQKMVEIKKNIQDKFLSEIGYRLKSIDPLDVVRDEERKKIKESIYSSAEEILEEGRDCCNNEYDFWEYLTMHNLSRHYTFLNVSSIRTIAEERTTAFDNQLFDFYSSLPMQDRFNKKIIVNAIRLLDERLYGIRNANTNFNIYDSDFTLTTKILINKIVSKLGFKVLLPPERGDRSGLIKADTIRDDAKVREKAENLANSCALDGLSFLDMDKIRFYVEKHLKEEGDYSDIIFSLITIDTFIKNSQL